MATTKKPIAQESAKTETITQDVNMVNEIEVNEPTQIVDDKKYAKMILNLLGK